MNFFTRFKLKLTGRGQYVRVSEVSNQILTSHEAPRPLFTAIQRRIEAAATHATPLPPGEVASYQEIEGIAYTLVFRGAIELMEEIKNRHLNSFLYNECLLLTERVAKTMVSNGYLEESAYEEIKSAQLLIGSVFDPFK